MSTFAVGKLHEGGAKKALFRGNAFARILRGVVSSLQRSDEEVRSMGLDIIEMVMAVEEKFGIEISDEAMSNTRTVGELHDLVCAQVMNVSVPHGVCPNVALLGRVRKALRSVAGNQPLFLRGSASISSLLPLASRATTWDMLRETSGLTWPRLQPTARRAVLDRVRLWTVLAAICMSILGAVILMLCSSNPTGLVTTVGLVIMFGGLFGTIGTLILLQSTSRQDYAMLPTNLSTLRELILATIELNKHRIAHGHRAADRIWDDLLYILESHADLANDNEIRFLRKKERKPITRETAWHELGL